MFRFLIICSLLLIIINVIYAQKDNLRKREKKRNARQRAKQGGKLDEGQVVNALDVAYPLKFFEASNNINWRDSAKYSPELLNQFGHPRSYSVDQRVKVYAPPTHEQMLASGRRAKHLLAWRGPCRVIEKLSETTYAVREESTNRRFERAVVNILPCRASEAPTPPTYD